MRTKARRIMTAFITFLLFVGLFSIQAFAASGSEMKSMSNRIMDWYRLIRDHIAVPLLIISFASCGFKILGSGFNNNGDKAISEAKSQFISSAIALLVLFMTPYLIGSAREMLENTGWKPPTTSVILPVSNFYAR